MTKRARQWTIPILMLILVTAGCSSSDDSSSTSTSAVSTTGDSSDTSTSAVSTTGAGGDLTGSIAVLLPDSVSAARWELADRPFFEKAFAAAGLGSDDYIILNAEGDAPTQVTQAEQAITNGAKVIVLVNLDNGSGAAIISSAQSQGVVAVDYDRLTLDGGADYYVSGDATDAGRLQGQGLVDCVASFGITEPQVAILDGSPTDSFATDLTTGYMEVLQPLFDSGAWTLVEKQAVPDWDPQQALTIFEQMLQASNNGVNAVVAANDGLAGAAVSALKSRGLGPFPITGLDATTEALQNILAGDQCMTVYFPYEVQAKLAADIAVAVVRGDEVPGITTTVNDGSNDIPAAIIPPVTVTIDNIADTVIADGFAKWDDLCIGDFEQYCPADR
ncbi:MAG: sugar ABC transporter substrate-binding protein [Mycobacterium sp.]